jgi:hypothetical protein
LHQKSAPQHRLLPKTTEDEPRACDRDATSARGNDGPCCWVLHHMRIFLCSIQWSASNFQWCRCSCTVPLSDSEWPCGDGDPTRRYQEATNANSCQWSCQGAGAHGQHPCHRSPSTRGHLSL